MAAIYVKVNGRYVAIPTLKGDTSDVSNDIISDAQSIVLPPSVKAIKNYVDDELDDALISAINSGDLVIAFNKYSDLPETGHYAYVRTNETTSQTGSVELVEGNQYTLYLNPAPNYDVEIYGFSITGATGFDDNKYSVICGTTSLPYIQIVAQKGTETHVWWYTEYGYYSELGWWYLVNEFGSNKSAVKIDYSELPILSGTVSHGGGALNLGFPFASETPYNTKNYGLYRYDETLEQWVWTDSGYFENQGVLGLFATTNGELTYDGKPIGYKISNADLLEKFTEENDQLYYDGMPISGVNVAKYATVNELDTNEDLIIAQVTTTQESWRSARRKQDATFTFVEVPKMPISDFTASAYKDGVLYADLEFEVNNLGLSEEGIGSFTVTVPNGETAGTIYVYIEHTATVTALDIEITFGWNRVTYTLVDGELVFGTIAHFPDANFTELPNFTELIINATNGALTGLQEFITTDTTNNEKTALRWIKEEGIYIVNADGDWRKYTSSYIADDYNRLPDDVPIGSTAITLADVEQEQEPITFESETVYDTVYLNPQPPLSVNWTVDGGFMATAKNLISESISSSFNTYISIGINQEFSELNNLICAYIKQDFDDLSGSWRYIYTETEDTYTWDAVTFTLKAGWNLVTVINDPLSVEVIQLSESQLPYFEEFEIGVNGEDWMYDFIDVLFNTTPYITRKAGGYTKLESGWEETVCIDPLVEVKANKVTTIDANSTDEEYPSAKAVYEFAPDMSGYLAGTYPVSPTGTEFLNGEGDFVEIEIPETVSTMTEYATALTLNNANYWTTTASIEFGLPTAVSGKKNTFTLFVKVTDAGHAVTFSPSGSQRLGAVAHTFGVGTHLVEGVYNPIDSKWLLGCSAVGVPA